MQRSFTSNAQKALKLAEKASKSMHHNYTGTEHLLLGLLREGTGVAANVLAENGVEAGQLMDLIENLIAPSGPVVAADMDGWTPRAEQILENAKREAERFSSKEVGTEHLLIAIIKETECAASRLMNTLSVNLQKLYVDTLIAMGEDSNLYREDFQNGKPSKRKSAANTPMLDQYARDLTRLAAQKQFDPVIGRDEEIKRVIQVLSRRGKNNPCLIGEPGVGKTAIVEGLAQQLNSYFGNLRRFVVIYACAPEIRSERSCKLFYAVFNYGRDISAVFVYLALKPRALKQYSVIIEERSFSLRLYKLLFYVIGQLYLTFGNYVALTVHVKILFDGNIAVQCKLGVLRRRGKRNGHLSP